MENMMWIQIGVISSLFFLFVVYLLINIFKMNRTIKQSEKMEREIIKRSESNVYDLNSRKRK